MQGVSIILTNIWQAYDPEKDVDILFRAPMRWLGRHSEPLRVLLDLTEKNGNSMEGKSDSTAIQLPENAQFWIAFFEWWDRTL